MVRTRARTFAAAVALGTAAPLLAQPPADEPSFVVLPPRALKLPQVPLNPNGAEIPVGFFTPATQPSVTPRQPISNPLQSVQIRPWSLTAPQSQIAPNPAPVQNQPRPSSQTFQVQPLTGGVQKPRTYPALTAPASAPASAPAWRWHGYGSAASGDPQPSTPVAMPLANTILNVPIPMAPPPQYAPVPAVPQPAVPLQMPTGTPMSAGEPVVPSLPSYTPPQTAPESPPFPPPASGDTTWKPSERISVRPANPMFIDREVVHAVAQAPATASRVAWVPNGVPNVQVANHQHVADARDDQSSLRAVFIPASPPPPPAPVPISTPESMTRLHSAVEMLLLGRGRDLELYQRNATSLLVRFKVRQAPDAEALANAISKLPGLAAYQVVYEISVAP